MSLLPPVPTSSAWWRDRLSSLGDLRRQVRYAAVEAGLPPNLADDIMLAANEACGRILRCGGLDAGGVLEISTHDRDHLFTVTVHDHAAAHISQDDTTANADIDLKILTHLADRVETTQPDGDGELTIVFAKPTHRA